MPVPPRPVQRRCDAASYITIYYLTYYFSATTALRKVHREVFSFQSQAATSGLRAKSHSNPMNSSCFFSPVVTSLGLPGFASYFVHGAQATAHQALVVAQHRAPGRQPP